MTTAIHSAKTEELASLFHSLFGGAPQIFWAPGRVNLIGDHTDYNDGFVMPMAIDRGVSAAVRARNDGILRTRSINFDETAEFNLASMPAKGNGRWSDFVAGVVVELQRGRPLRGADLLITGDIPLGSGLSSSAGIEVAVATAVSRANGIEIDPVELALLCQRAENNFVGAQCGIMDQFISANGRAGHAMMLDCRTLKAEYQPLPKGVSVFVCNSMVKHSIAGGEYNSRRAECEQAVQLLKTALPHIKALRDVSPEELAAHSTLLPPILLKRARHVVTENSRVLQAAAALEQADLRTFGSLMDSSHESLRDDYEVSVPELDLLVETAQAVEGVYGARMTGGGFGGCIVALADGAAISKLRDSVERAFRSKFNITPESYECVASDGVHRLM